MKSLEEALSMNGTILPPGYVWHAVLDKRYIVEVTRLNGTDKYTGILTVIDGNDMKVIHSESVQLSYGALFGPDALDVSDWGNIAVNIIDGTTDKE